MRRYMVNPSAGSRWWPPAGRGSRRSRNDSVGERPAVVVPSTRSWLRAAGWRRIGDGDKARDENSVSTSVMREMHWILV